MLTREHSIRSDFETKELSRGAYLPSGQRAAGRRRTLLDVRSEVAAPMAELGQGCGEGPPLLRRLSSQFAFSLPPAFMKAIAALALRRRA